MRKVCVVITNRASYSRIKYLLIALKKEKNIELQIIAGASLLLYNFGNAYEVIEKDGFKINKKINYVVEGSDLSSQAKSTGLGIVELTTAFNDLSPDIVITVADRYETIATAIAATYLNIFLVHIQGGEVSGNIDDRVRHAITKLSDLHFPATFQSMKRILSMGEQKNRVFCYGCPSIDLIKNTNLKISNKKMSKYGGTGNKINWEEKFILVVYHPVTTTYGHGYGQMNKIIKILNKFKYQKIVLWPNIDAGSHEVSKSIREFKENQDYANFHFFRNFDPEDYLKILNSCICAVGNSSSFLREASFLGTPSVIIGDRQKNRECGNNVIYSDFKINNIYKNIKLQINNKKYKKSYIYGNGNSSFKITKKILNVKIDLKKRITI